MAEVKIKKNRVEVLKVSIEDKSYSIPLIGSMKLKKIRELKECKTDEQLVSFLSEYIPTDVLEEFTSADLNQLVTAWRDASTEAQGAKVGESSASSIS
jgi:hypothetical protein